MSTLATKSRLERLETEQQALDLCTAIISGVSSRDGISSSRLRVRAGAAAEAILQLDGEKDTDYLTLLRVTASLRDSIRKYEFHRALDRRVHVERFQREEGADPQLLYQNISTALREVAEAVICSEGIIRGDQYYSDFVELRIRPVAAPLSGKASIFVEAHEFCVVCNQAAGHVQEFERRIRQVGYKPAEIGFVTRSLLVVPDSIAIWDRVDMSEYFFGSRAHDLGGVEQVLAFKCQTLADLEPLVRLFIEAVYASPRPPASDPEQ